MNVTAVCQITLAHPGAEGHETLTSPCSMDEASKASHSNSRFAANFRQVPLPCQSTFTWLVAVSATWALVLAASAR